jgi:ubiquinone/menaquinone biosynthesis C-methylase UbiE
VNGTVAPRGAGRETRHYSYAVYADPEMARRFDELRFSGPIGTLIAETQEQVLSEFLGDVRGTRVLDVGTGTGRAALSLAARGARVSGVDASSEMLRVARARAEAAGLAIAWSAGDAHHLAFDDRSVDAAVSLRVLMHTLGWEACVAELCRVARQKVVVDYPSATSAASLHAVARRVRTRVSRLAPGRPATAGRPRTDLEAYRVFTLRRLRRAFARHGFEVVRLHRQFVLPIAVHKAVGSRAVTRGVEGVLAAVGLLRLFGSPVTLLAERRPTPPRAPGFAGAPNASGSPRR